MSYLIVFGFLAVCVGFGIALCIAIIKWLNRH